LPTWRRDTLVCIVIRLKHGRGRRFFSSPKCQDQRWGPTRLLFSGHRGSFPALKRAGRDFDHSSSCSTEVKNEWNYICIPPVRLHDVDRDNFILFTFSVTVAGWYKGNGFWQPEHWNTGFVSRLSRRSNNIVIKHNLYPNLP
jgi:hypothetical protein